MRISIAMFFLFFVSLIPTVAATPNIRVDGAWAAPTPNGAQTGVAYMVIHNQGPNDDRLVGGTSPAADKIQVHEMKVTNDIMEMREVVDGLPVAAGRTAELKPGGFHMMLIGLKRQLRAGQDIVLTLRFEHAGEVLVHVPVRADSRR
ncbi:MAG TPA: copper chaperone PCu(A)C [Acidobacteriaceae bacterium]|nr:copper chaperone PCu(A)C [Acidobacteriaceae bacterium]